MKSGRVGGSKSIRVQEAVCEGPYRLLRGKRLLLWVIWEGKSDVVLKGSLCLLCGEVTVGICGQEQKQGEQLGGSSQC